VAGALIGLEPAYLWKHFQSLVDIPRCSGKEALVRDHLVGVALERGWGADVDDVGNLVVRVPGSKGCEKSPTLVLQGHLDIVCEKNEDVDHDFTTDPIAAFVDGDVVRARGTTLGSDNGIGVAAGLALADDPAVSHGPLEILCTVEEETGLTGAAALDAKLLRGRLLLNLDTEEEGAVYVGCAGGGDQLGSFLAPRVAPPTDAEVIEIRVRGLKGGHSGLDIHLGRGNAIVVLARLLERLIEVGLLRGIDTFGGGNMHNAIPREARATVRVTPGSKPALDAEVAARLADEKETLNDADPGLTITVHAADGLETTHPVEELERILHFLQEVPHGVVEMSPDIDALVQTSNNLAVVKDEGETVLVHTSSRSSVSANLERLRDHICGAMDDVGASVEREDAYPGWEPNMDSALLARCRRVHADLFGAEPEIKAIHAGLECGIIGERIPGMDMASIGPNIFFPHSPDEHVEIASVAKFWTFLVGVVESLAKEP
jgi:dipeptidase D